VRGAARVDVGELERPRAGAAAAAGRGAARVTHRARCGGLLPAAGRDPGASRPERNPHARGRAPAERLMTDRYAVIGHPVTHSLSPRIHRAFAAATGQDLSYELLPAPLDAFAATARAFFAAGGAGLNVTVPF